MVGPNPNWHFSKQLHSLNNAILTLIRYESEFGKAENRCALCAQPFPDLAPGPGPLVVFKADNGLLVCQDCFCEHKDDFNWPTYDGLA